MARAKATALAEVSNGGEEAISFMTPYRAVVEIEGVVPILFHRWNVEAVAEKAAAKKGSAAKKTDDIESYLYRNEEGEICIPGLYLISSMTDPKNGAAKYLQDPRSPRKSALDLFKSGVCALTELASTGVKEWDYVDQRRVNIQRNGITRSRPALSAGWRIEVELQVLLPEYINQNLLLQTLTNAGRLTGIADFRPTYGRFQVNRFQVLTD